jgi:protein SCO1/2
MKWLTSLGVGVGALLIAVAVAGFVLPLLRGGSGPAAAAAPELEVYFPAPDFALTDQAGQTLTRDDLLGQVWVAKFFFTRCPGICPMMSANAADLQRDLAEQPWADRVRLVSFSLDPERDTPQVLADYAEALGVSPRQWAFVRGTQEQTWSLSQDGFKLAVADTPDDPQNPISHSGNFVLVDQRGRVRGYYDGLRAQGIAELRRDIERLINAE